jgi:hypothetical protein
MLAYLKALTAAIAAGLGTLLVALDDHVVTPAEWVKVAISIVLALGAVWAVPNATTKDKTS